MPASNIHDDIRSIKKNMEAIRHRLKSEEHMPSSLNISELDETLILHLKIKGYDDRDMRIECFRREGAISPFLLDGENEPIELSDIPTEASKETISHITNIRKNELPQCLCKYIQSRAAKNRIANICISNDFELKVRIPNQKPIVVSVYDFDCIEVSRPRTRQPNKFFKSFSDLWEFLSPHLGEPKE